MDSLLDLALTEPDNYLHFHLGLCQLHPLSHGCRGRPTVQHIIPRAWTVKNKEKRKASEHPKLLAIVCLGCNSETKFADTKRARAFLLGLKIGQNGYEEIEKLVAATGFSLEALLAPLDTGGTI